MNTQAYLERIRYGGNPDPSADTLAALQAAHLLTVPFENLDIGLGVPIVLEPASLFDKIVRRRRGGFCYELNGLFHHLLLALGFRSTMVSARVFDAARGAYGAEFDHLALLVDVAGGRYLSDVGFGAFSVKPLPVRTGSPIADTGGVFRFDEAWGGRLVVLRRRDDGGEFDPQYDFTTEPRSLQDFAGMCLYHQTSPESHFTRNRICSLATGEGRITLSPGRIIETSAAGRTEIPVAGPEAWRAALADRFGIIF